MGLDDRVTALAVSGTDTYFGGGFTGAGGMTRHNIARLNAGGTLDATWDPNANGVVSTLAVAGTAVYAGGSFTMIGGQYRFTDAHLAAIIALGEEPTTRPAAAARSRTPTG